MVTPLSAYLTARYSKVRDAALARRLLAVH